MEDLPNEILMHCIPKVENFTDFMTLRLISRRFNDLLISNAYWKIICEQDNYAYVCALLSRYYLGLRYYEAPHFKNIKPCYVGYLASDPYGKSVLAIKNSHCGIPHILKSCTRQKKLINFSLCFTLVLCKRHEMLRDQIRVPPPLKLHSDTLAREILADKIRNFVRIFGYKINLPN